MCFIDSCWWSWTRGCRGGSVLDSGWVWVGDKALWGWKAWLDKIVIGERRSQGHVGTSVASKTRYRNIYLLYQMVRITFVVDRVVSLSTYRPAIPLSAAGSNVISVSWPSGKTWEELVSWVWTNSSEISEWDILPVVCVVKGNNFPVLFAYCWRCWWKTRQPPLAGLPRTGTITGFSRSTRIPPCWVRRGLYVHRTK